MKRLLYLILLLITLPSSYADQKRDMMLPDLSIKLINGKQTRLSSLLEDGPLLVNFWATWCAPCMREMPSLDYLNKDSNFKNLKVFPVNVGKDNALKTIIFFNDLNIQNLEIFFDSNLNLVNEFKLRGVPTTILINKKGEEFARIIGEVNFQDKKFSKWLLKYD